MPFHDITYAIQLKTSVSSCTWLCRTGSTRGLFESSMKPFLCGRVPLLPCNRSCRARLTNSATAPSHRVAPSPDARPDSRAAPIRRPRPRPWVGIVRLGPSGGRGRAQGTRRLSPRTRKRLSHNILPGLHADDGRGEIAAARRWRASSLGCTLGKWGCAQLATLTL